MIPYPKTKRFHSVIKTVTWQRPSDPSAGYPVLKFVGTVKLHDTNAAIGYQKDRGYWLQSRSKIITPLKDNMDFAQTMNPLAKEFFFDRILLHHPTMREYYECGCSIVIYGEWCDGNIQNNVAIYDLPKMFVIFKVRIVDATVASEKYESIDQDSESEQEAARSNNKFWPEPNQWSDIRWPEHSIYSIFDFPTYNIEIDFNQLDLSQNRLVEITRAVKRQCPVGAHFNKPGIGEDVVWTEWAHSRGRLAFKVKETEHSVTKTQRLAAVDVEKLTSLNEFVDYACTENRMIQGLNHLHE
ncbi:unnamed protein product [Rotaria sp. Silwood2]|nr:unnamed protein product [Rotaria sp. Silwood2]CAF4594812.1 unnamed protein product [Rotaria sp. Silwood2]